jgi:hypothetical protein
VRVLGEEPGPGLPNQHAKACPRFQTMHCWCPPATGPNQPHQPECSHYRRPDFWIAPKFEQVKSSFFGHGLPYSAAYKLTQKQAQAYAAAIS